MKICALTMVYRDYWALAQWYAHYGRLLGPEHLFVIAHGQDDRVQQICPEASVITIPRDDLTGFDRVRGQMLNSFQAGLCEVYDWIIRTDTDELICLDPAHYQSFAGFFAAQKAPALFALGLNVFDTEAGHRGVFTGHYSKAWAVRQKVPLVQHGIQVPVKRVDTFKYRMPAGVYLAHLKYANKAALLEANEHRRVIAAGSEKGLPGKAWAQADQETVDAFAKVADMEEVAWDVARDEAFGRLHRRPKRDPKDGTIRTRSVRFHKKAALPAWFPLFTGA